MQHTASPLVVLRGEWFEYSPGFVALLAGPDLVFELVNSEYLRFVGRERHELMGRALLDAMPELQGQGYENLLGDVLTTGRPFVGRALKVALRSGPGTELVESFIDLLYHPVYDCAGECVVGVLVQGHDVTEHQQALKALEEADKNKDDFMWKLSHELRNPLSPIKMAVHLLSQHPAAADPALKKVIGVIERQTGALLGMVDDLQDVGRVKLGKISLHRQTISLQDVVATALEQCEGELHRNGHELELHLCEQPVWVSGDLQRLTQAVSNLVNNACKYTPAHGRICVSMSSADGWAQITVADNGIGIAPDFIDRVFDLFGQSPDAKRSGPGGLGIGLSLVKQLVELHDGTVAAASEGLSRGSTFQIRLPISH